MAKMKDAELSLEAILWNCRNALRGTVGGNEKNRDAVMGLVFLVDAGKRRCTAKSYRRTVLFGKWNHYWKCPV
jgi:hypothetical protein